MKLIEFIFLFMRTFTKTEPERIAKLNEDAALWISNEKEQNTKKGKFIQASELWYWQILLAVLSPTLIKLYANWLTSAPKEENEENDNDKFFI
jgi:hypothetical protein